MPISNVSEGNPVAQLTKDLWPGLEDEFYEDISGALWRESNKKVYLFKRHRHTGEYTRFTPQTFSLNCNYPKAIGLSGEEIEFVWLNRATHALSPHLVQGRPACKVLAEAVRQDFGAQWGFCAFFLKYPVPNTGYALSKFKYLMIRRDHFQPPSATDPPDHLDETFAHDGPIYLFKGPDCVQITKINEDWMPFPEDVI